jgi:hypothetical protein
MISVGQAILPAAAFQAACGARLSTRNRRLKQLAVNTSGIGTTRLGDSFPSANGRPITNRPQVSNLPHNTRVDYTGGCAK